MNPPTRPSTALVLVAAGTATRMGATAVRKPFLPLGSRTVIETAAAAFDALDCVREIVIVAHADDLARMRELARSSSSLKKLTAVVAGGAARSDSVRLGVAEVGASIEVVCVHDAARPLIERDVVARSIDAAWQHDAALVAVPVRDTIKVSSNGAFAEHTLERDVLWSAQTPQTFKAAILRELLERAHRDGFRPTDDAALFEHYRGPVALVEGDPQNLKITTPGDLAMAEAILSLRAKRERSP